MRSWLRIGTVGAGLLAVLGSPILAERASAQAEERRRVMVTNLEPINDANKRFGRDLAKELRDLINQLPTHQPVDEDDVKDAAKQYDLEYDELDCVQSLQLASIVRASLVFCGSVTEDEEARTFSMSGIQFAAPGGASFAIEDKTWGRDDSELAAQDIAGSFDDFVTQSRHATFCGEDFESKNWEGAMTNCTAALEMNPTDTRVRFVYANVLHGLERLDEAYAETQRVMEEDPLHEQALQLAGYLAAQLGDEDAARQYYANYLQLNPGNAQVRMRVAYDLAQAGDPEGAMLLSEEGLELEGDNVDLLLLHAQFATRAAQNVVTAAEPGTPLSIEAAGLFQKAQASYQVAYDERGVDMEAGHLRNMIATFSELEQIDEGVAIVEQVLQTHDGEAQFWSIYADLLKKADRVDEAIAALGEAEQRDPDYQNIKTRQGTWLVDIGREDEALPYLQEATEKGEQSADVIANSVLFNAAVQKGIQVQNWSYAIKMMRMAKTFDAELSDGARGRLDFYYAYSIYAQAVIEQEAQNLQSAQVTLPRFREVGRLLGLSHVVTFGNENQAQQFQQLRDATQQYIEIQEAIIQRGR